MLDAKIVGVTLLEPLTFAADAVPKERVGANDTRDRVDLFLTDLVHGVPPDGPEGLGIVSTTLAPRRVDQKGSA